MGTGHSTQTRVAYTRKKRSLSVLDEEVENDGAFVAARLVERLVARVERLGGPFRELVVQHAPVVLQPAEMAAGKEKQTKRSA